MSYASLIELTLAGLKVYVGALKMQDKTLLDRTMTDKRSTMPE